MIIISKEETHFGFCGEETKGKEYDPFDLAFSNYLEKDHYYCSGDDQIPLHKQPEAVLRSVVHLAEILRNKKLIDDVDFLTILGVEYNHSDYEIKEEKN